ncbi:MAG: extracellular solute-binding protein [Spirochaetaceae bacterium]|jgi:putative aldouronate transport system substrate-binding protein|nr:extracellular solute-binding protein [Spirochaetaceae bacterium]
MKFKKTILIALCAIISVGFAFANGEQQSSGSTGSAAATGQETFTLWKMMDTNDYYVGYSNNPTIQFLNRKFNVKLDFQEPAVGQEATAISLMFGTGEYTDAVYIQYYTGSIQELYEDGVIINIADYLDSMPNYKAYIEANPKFKRNVYDDNGRILSMPTLAGEGGAWGGLAYNRGILDEITNKNPQFPSGNSEPTTIEDMEYMLALYRQYFDSKGKEYAAPLMLPYNALFVYSELESGFGIINREYVENDVVKYGPIENGFRNYIAKMAEWYKKGWIYNDFASRVNDPPYLPNPAMTYGGDAGIWFGLMGQLGDKMSQPDHNLYTYALPLKSPLDTAHGIKTAASPISGKAGDIATKGWVITKACKNPEKLLAIFDYLYTDEGAKLYYGVTKEQGADKDPAMIKAKMQDGAYWYDAGGNFVWNPEITFGGGKLDFSLFNDGRLPGLRPDKDIKPFNSDLDKLGESTWSAYSDSPMQLLPMTLSYTADDEKKIANNNVQIRDYLNVELAKFILGTTPLNDETWNAYTAQLKNLGVTENIALQQEAYNRWLKR